MKVNAGIVLFSRATRLQIRGFAKHMSKHVVAAVAEIPPGARKLVKVNGRAVVVFNLGGEFFALSDRCPHKGGSLSKGKLTGLVESSMPGEYRYGRRGEII